MRRGPGCGCGCENRRAYELAFKIAAEGSVLLKNQHGVLPFDANVHVLAVIGDDAGAHVQTTERYGDL